MGDKTWHTYNDSNVLPIDEASVLDEEYSGDHVGPANAYLLWYRRVSGENFVDIPDTVQEEVPAPAPGSQNQACVRLFRSPPAVPIGCVAAVFAADQQQRLEEGNATRVSLGGYFVFCMLPSFVEFLLLIIAIRSTPISKTMTISPGLARYPP